MFMRHWQIIDGSLVWRYVELDTALQHELAEAMMSKRGVILQNLIEIDRNIACL